jgi:hypothetical protein
MKRESVDELAQPESKGEREETEGLLLYLHAHFVSLSLSQLNGLPFSPPPRYFQLLRTK